MIDTALIKRYVKDKGLYTEFKQRVRNFCAKHNYKGGLQEIADYYGSEICVLQMLEMPGEYNDYFSAFKYYIYEEDKEKYIKLFTDFLGQKNSYLQFFENVDEKFIKKEIEDREGIFIDGDKKELIFNNLIPESYLMFAFYWRDTKQGHDYWEKINNQWEKILNNEKRQKNKE